MTKEVVFMKYIMCLVFLSVPAWSQEQVVLTIEEAVRVGLAQSAPLTMSNARLSGAEAKAHEADAARLPSIKGMAGYTRLSDVDPFAVTLPSSPVPVVISPTVLDQYTAKVSLQQPLFTGFRLSNAAQAAHDAAEAARLDYASEEDRTVYAVTAAYWKLYQTLEAQRAIDDNVLRMQAHLRNVETLHQQGVVTRNEVLQVQVQLSSSRLAQIDAQNNVAMARMGLNGVLRLPLDTKTVTGSTIQPRENPVSVMQALEHAALSTRPDLQAASMRAQAAKAGVTAAQGGWYPTVNFVANATYARPNPRILPVRDEFKGTWDVGVVVSFNVWDWGATGNQVEQAEATWLQAKTVADVTRDAVIVDVHQSSFGVAFSAEKIRVATKGVEQAEEHDRMTREKFSNGTATSTDVLDAGVALVQAKLNQTGALVESELAHAALAKSLGRMGRTGTP
jgi:outer membrane protein TolC